jgi:quinoprotein glucose dehydrogenase
LFTLRRRGSSIPAVAIGTKMGHVFVLDRRDGKALFPVEERPVPPSDVPGEKASPTQPFPPPAFRLVPESLSVNDAFGVTDSARASCRARIAALRFQGIFTPPSQQGTIVWPGNLGGVNWSGVSVDEQRGLLIAPTNRLAMVVRLIPRDSLHAAYTARPDIEYGREVGTPYAMSRDDLRICTPPPWGALTAIDLTAGKVKWEVPLGTLPPLDRIPAAKQWGSFALGGALLTSSGLAFIAGTFDQHLRAFDVSSGKELWSESLPAAAHALPMTYVIGGRQYLVIAAGGHDRMHTTMGDYVLAFTLPASGAPPADTTGGGPLDGNWAGEMRVGGASFRMNVTLRGTAATPTATVEIDSIRVTGAITPTRSGRSIRIAFPFLYPPKNNCTGQVSLTVALWNAGKLLEGNGAVDGACAERGHQDAAFAFHRR